MNATATPTVQSRQIADTESRQMYDLLSLRSDAMQSWKNDGSAAEDVAHTVGNVIQSVRYVPEYKVMRDKMMERCSIDERMLITQVLNRFARPVPSKKRQVS